MGRCVGDAPDLNPYERLSATQEPVVRIDFVGAGHPRTVAKSLKRALAARGKEIGLRRCEEIFAKMTGYQNWHELHVVTARTMVASMKDMEVGEAEAGARREQFASRLSELAQIDRAVADDIVDQIRPTGLRKKAEASLPEVGFPAP